VTRQPPGHRTIKRPLLYGMEEEDGGSKAAVEVLLLHSFAHDGAVQAVRIHVHAGTGTCTAVSGTDTGAVHLFDIDKGAFVTLV
jgi:hypothetical protein